MSRSDDPSRAKPQHSQRQDPPLASLMRGRLGRAFVLTWIGLCAERLWRRFWPAAAVSFVILGTIFLGLGDLLPIEALWLLAVLLGGALSATLLRGLWLFRLPRRQEALDRLDQSLPGRPIAALSDRQALPGDDPATQALWAAHQARMARTAAAARPVQPDLRVARRDPYALRYVALVFLTVGALFGPGWRSGAGLGGLFPRGQAGLVAGDASWEGWIEPPHYTGLPALYLGDLAQEPRLELPEGSQVTLRFYGRVGDLALAETVSGRTGELPAASDSNQSFSVTRSGEIAIDGPGGQVWQVEVLRDHPPEITITQAPDLTEDGLAALPFHARDDYGVTGGEVAISLDLDAVDRRYGLATQPDPREPIQMPLPLPVTGDRHAFDEALLEDFSEHPWANLPVHLQLVAEDAAGQRSAPALAQARLIARRFFDPMAAALIEQRRDLLWARANAPRVAQVLRTLSYRPEDIFDDMGDYLRLRTIIRRLEAATPSSGALLAMPAQEEIAQALWDLAVALEDGDVGSALERMRQAQERLSQAMRDGAAPAEIERLMQELRAATEDYMRQLSRQAQSGDDGENSESGDSEAMQLSQADLQAMMDRIQELMEQGRMAEAEQALREFQQMMENMRVTQGEGGEGSGTPGEQAMEDLAQTLRDQQGLSDQAFRDLQEQFRPGGQSGVQNGGQSNGPGGEQGDGTAQGPSGQPGQGPSGQIPQQGQGGPGTVDEGAEQPGATGEEGPRSLADGQRSLRETLDRQRDGLPLGGEGGAAARGALDQAGRAMEDAEEALRGGDYAEALDRQSEAMEALRDGMRALGDAMAQQQGEGGGQQGTEPGGSARQGNATDPLGRSRNGSGGDYLGRDAIGDAQAYRRAWDLLEEIRRRAGERERSEDERGYLQRLLDRF